MKTKFGAIIVDGRGKIGGYVASKNHEGSFLRIKNTPLDNKTDIQLLRRQQLTNVSQFWRTISQSDRNRWEAYAHEMTAINIWGDRRKRSGYHVFVEVNMNRLMIPNSLLWVPNPIGHSLDTYGFIPSASIANQSFSLTVVNAGLPGYVLFLGFTPCVSAGLKNAFAKFRHLGKIFLPSTGTFTFPSEYIAQHGPITGPNTKFFYRTAVVHSQSGFRYPYRYGFVIPS